MKKSLTIGEKVYKSIKQNILNGKLQPRQRLYEEELAREYNTSRGPVREALSRLSKENFVCAIPRKGVYVAPSTKKEIKNTYEIREKLELLAIEKSLGKISLEELDIIKNKLIKFENLEINNENKLKYLSLDRKLHYLLFKNCDNEMLLDLLIHFQGQMKRFQKYALNINSFKISINEHLEIIESVKKNDFNLIKKLLINHLNRVEESYFYQFME